jgi:hypothetical protein
MALLAAQPVDGGSQSLAGATSAVVLSDGDDDSNLLDSLDSAFEKLGSVA